MYQEEAIKQLLIRYVRAGLIECSAEKVLDCVSNDIFGIGMGEQGFVSSKEQVRDIIQNTAKIEQNVTHSLLFDFIEIHFQSETVASVCAKIHVNRTQNGKTTKSGLMQSLTVRFENGKWLICALHASPILLTEECIEAYPLRFADNTLAHLKADLQSDAFDLINQSISGGILGAYVQNACFPLYFVNDGMLAYLGYTREEFIQKCQSDILNLVYEEDKQRVYALLCKAAEDGTDYEARFRMLKKDGSFLWMANRGRKSTDECGREILFGVFVDITEMILLQQELEAQAKALSISEERFRIALEKTTNAIFDYDIISGNIMHSSTPKKSLDFVTSIQDAKDTLILGGSILEESMVDFTLALEQIRNGEKQSSCVVQVRMNSGNLVWDKISMSAVFDDSGRTVRAIGIIEDITKQKEAELAYLREEQYRKAILGDAMAFYLINFTKDRCESCQIKSSYCIPIEPESSYDRFIYNASKTRLNEEDRRAFLDKFSKASVLDAFENNISEIKLEYLSCNPDGTSVWMQTILRLVLDVTTNERKGFLYVTDIDQRKREELKLTRLAERDSLTGVYNKAAAEEKIRNMLKTKEGMQSGVFMMIDVDRFKDINDTYGHPFGDRVLSDAAAGICSHFRENDIVGRLGGDEFCVFFCGMRSRDRIKQAARELCGMFRQLFCSEDGNMHLSCSIGITTCTGKEKSFEQIYSEADQALYHAKKAGRNRYCFFSEENCSHLL